jgi:protein-disulfide isomerase
MRRFLPFFIVALVAAATLSAATWLYRTKMAAAVAALPAKPAAAPVEKEDTSDVHSLGAANPLVTLEEFGDFQCPPCGMLSAPINQMIKEFPQMRLVFKDFPLAMHQHGMEAAHAAEAAALQGHFWEMHDVLFHEQAVWSKSSNVNELFYAYAAMIKCNVSRFKKDMDGDEVAERVRKDQAEGKKLGVTNTPTIFLNDKAVPPSSLSPKDLHDAIESHIKQIQAGVTPTPWPSPTIQ